MTEREAFAILALLSQAYPGKELPKETSLLYVEEMADLDPDRTYEAAKRWIRSEKWFPSIAELREAAGASKESRPSGADAQVRASYRRLALSTIETLGWESAKIQIGEHRLHELFRPDEIADHERAALTAPAPVPQLGMQPFLRCRHCGWMTPDDVAEAPLLMARHIRAEHRVPVAS